jgi:Mg-chelatase subunit ChlD
MKKVSRKEPTTIVNFILDKSGSMNSVLDATISGFNEYLGGLQRKKDKILFSLTLFDTSDTETPYLLKPIRQVKPLTKKTYIPSGGTPLYDAVVETIEKVASQVKEMAEKPIVLTVIMTDGEENSSVKHNEKCLKDLVEKLQKEGNWTFVFMGANQDAWSTASGFGFMKGNTLSYLSTSRGTNQVFMALSNSTTQFVSAKAMSTADFFAGGEKKDDS